MAKFVGTIPNCGKCSGASFVILENEEGLDILSIDTRNLEAEVVCLQCGQRLGYATDIPDQVGFVLSILVRNCFTCDGKLVKEGKDTKCNLRNVQDLTLKAELRFFVGNSSLVSLQNHLLDQQKDALPPLVRQVLNRICEQRKRVFIDLTGSDQLLISYAFRRRRRIGALVLLESMTVVVQLDWKS